MDKLIDKLQPPALNRPPTQQQRVPDPGRFRSIDMQPENAQQDPSYQRMVQDIEALQHRQGWLAGRGAFDKEDLLYLRDREEQQRMTEQGQRDMEAAAYAAARARSAREQEAAARATLRQQQPAKQHSKSAHNKVAVPVLKVKAHHSRGQQCQQQPSAGQPVQPEQPEQERAPDLKRPRFEVIDRANAADGVAAVPAAASAKQPVAAAGTSCSISSQQQDRSRAAASGETATTSRKHHDTQAAGQLQQQGQPRSRQEERVGIQGLLGYSSDSDGQEDAELGSACQAAGTPSQRLKLPSAAELLEQELPSSFALATSPASADVASASVACVGSAAVYQHLTGWI